MKIIKFSSKTYFIFLATLFLISFSTYLLLNYYNNNFHAVIKNKIYRSGQLSPNQLATDIKTYNIKSILNLRGTNPDASWYIAELTIAKRFHVTHYDITLGSKSMPSLQELKHLAWILQTAPKPILIHCLGGADRTGLAAAISIVLLQDNPSLDDIEDQISWQYDVLSPFSIGYQVINNYLQFLALQNLQNSKDNFIVWLQTTKKLKPYSGWFFT